VACLAEANLRRWSGLHLARVEGGNDSRQPTLFTKLAPLPSQPGVVVRGALPLVSPWRVLMLGAKPGDLVESTILTSLADPNEIGDTSWIKPGKVAWDWWNGPVVPGVPWKAGMNTETFRHFVDFAAEFGLEYVLIDAGWYGDHRDGEADITKADPGDGHPRPRRLRARRRASGSSSGSTGRRRATRWTWPSRSTRSGASPA
jgi:alpha-glucosidase